MTRIEELEAEIKKNQELYYNDEAVLTDAEFDALVDELKSLDPNNVLLTTEVGEDHTDGFKKEKHWILMGSQSKANTESEMNEWISKIDNSNVLGGFKMDGISLELNYKNGTLVSAITRGNGIEGDNVTSNVKKMNVPNNIDKSFTGSVRGEVLISRKNKDKFYPEKKNCRCTAAGLMHHIDGEGCEHLDIVCYDAQFLDKSKSFGTQEHLMDFLKKNGFKVSEYKFFGFLDGKTAMAYLTEVFNHFDELIYDIDGIVWKQNKIDMSDMTTNVRPKTNIALKPAKVFMETKVLNIVWQVRNGTLTPVLEIEPIDLLGATMSRVTGNNVSFLEEMNIEIGDTIKIFRGGMIIPVVYENVTKKTFNKKYH